MTLFCDLNKLVFQKQEFFYSFRTPPQIQPPNYFIFFKVGTLSHYDLMYNDEVACISLYAFEKGMKPSILTASYG